VRFDLDRDRVFAAAIGIGLLLLVFVYLPGLDNYLARDDFSWVQTAARILKDPWLFVAPQNLWLRHTESLFFLACTVTFGMSSFGFQLGALLLHLANFVLVTLLIARVTGSRGGGLAGGLYWALDYRHVEVVFRPYAVADSLSLGFGVGALLLLCRGRRWLAAVFLVVALFGKNNAAVIPALATLILLGQSPRPERLSLLRPTLPLWALAVAFLLVENALASAASYLTVDWNALGRLGDLALSFVGPDLTTLRLSAFPQRPTLIPPWVVAVTLPAVALAVARLPRTLRIAVIWTAISVAPSLFISHQTSRYHYLPLVGVGIAVGYAVSRWAAWGRRRGSTASAILLVTVVAVTGLYLVAGVTLEERDYDFLGAMHRDVATSFVRDVVPHLPEDPGTMVLFMNGPHEPWVRMLQTRFESRPWYVPGTYKWIFVRPHGVLGLTDTFGFVTFCASARRGGDPFVPLPLARFRDHLRRGEYVLVTFDPTTRRYRVADDRLRAALGAADDPDRLYVALQPGHFSPTPVGPTTLER